MSKTMSQTMRVVSRAAVSLAVGLALAGVVVGTTATPAMAHNRLKSSTPADGATLATAPPEARLTFAQRIAAGSTQVAVTDDTGASVPSPAYRVEGATLIQPLTLPRPGRYQIGFRVVSTDGHPVSGKISFTVTSVPGAPTVAPTAASTSSPESSPQLSQTPAADASAEPSASGSTVAAGDSGSGWTTPVLVAGGVVVIGAVAIALVARRRRDGSPADGEPAD